MFAEDTSAFFETSGFAVAASWQPSGGGTAQTANVIFEAPDDQLGMGEMNLITRNYRITYPAAKLAGLDNGEVVMVNGTAYIVREVRQIDDGALVEAILGVFIA